jgi:hypothetical protein
MQSKRFIAILTLGLVIVLAAGAMAATETFSAAIPAATTDWSNILTFDKFDSSLGTLNSVQVQVSAGLSVDLTLTNNSASTIGDNSYVFFQSAVTVADPGGQFVNDEGSAINDTVNSNQIDVGGLTPGNQVVHGPETTYAYVHTTYSVGNGDLDVMSEFTGGPTDTIDLSAVTSTQFFEALENGVGSIHEDGSVMDGLTAKVIYNYTPSAPVPEPSSVIALGSGFMGLVAFMVRRRK